MDPSERRAEEREKRKAEANAWKSSSCKTSQSSVAGTGSGQGTAAKRAAADSVGDSSAKKQKVVDSGSHATLESSPPATNVLTTTDVPSASAGLLMPSVSASVPIWKNPVLWAGPRDPVFVKRLCRDMGNVAPLDFSLKGECRNIQLAYGQGILDRIIHPDPPLVGINYSGIMADAHREIATAFSLFMTKSCAVQRALKKGGVNDRVIELEKEVADLKTVVAKKAEQETALSKQWHDAEHARKVAQRSVQEKDQLIQALQNEVGVFKSRAETTEGKIAEALRRATNAEEVAKDSVLLFQSSETYQNILIEQFDQGCFHILRCFCHNFPEHFPNLKVARDWINTSAYADHLLALHPILPYTESGIVKANDRVISRGGTGWTPPEVEPVSLRTLLDSTEISDDEEELYTSSTPYDNVAEGAGEKSGAGDTGEDPPSVDE